MSLRIPGKTKLKLTVVDAQGAVGTSKEYDINGTRNSAIKKFSSSVSVPSEVLYKLRKTGKAEHTYVDGTKLLMEVVSETESMGFFDALKKSNGVGEVALDAGVNEDSKNAETTEGAGAGAS